jgi:Ca2+-binding RTX toxin-like protein
MSHTKATNVRRLGLENLETRELKAADLAVSLSHGILKVVGTSGNDTITIRQADARITVSGVASFAAADVHGVKVVGREGSDFIDLAGVHRPALVEAGDGNDKVWGGSAFNVVFGGSGNDELHGGAGTDILIGGDDNDLLYGGAGNDYLFGDAGDDRLSGGDGNDFLVGGAGMDSIYGGAGRDMLLGGTGYDMLNGGSGENYLADTWFYHRGDGVDHIQNRLWATPYVPAYSSIPNATTMKNLLGDARFADLFADYVLSRPDSGY